MTEKIAAEDDKGKRFDTVARAAFPALRLSEIFQAIRVGRLKLNGVKTKGSVRINTGDILQYYGYYEEASDEKDFSFEEAEESGLSVIWENEHFLALNKPRGVKVHDGPQSLQALVRRRQGKNASLSFRPGPCHRLDRNTSGVIVFAKTAHGARQFSQKQKAGRFAKIYIGLLKGCFRDEACWRSNLGYREGLAYESPNGSLAVTYVKPLACSKGKTLALFRLGSGRTHQIRVQAALTSYPLEGDVKYGGGGKGHYYLHALLLKDEGEEALFPKLWAPLPAEIEAILPQFQTDIQIIKDNSLRMKAEC